MRINSIISALVLSFATITAVGCAAGGDEFSTEDGFEGAESTATSPGKVTLYQSTDGQWRFRVQSGNNRNLLQSEAYTTKAAAQNGVDSVLENGVDPAMYQTNQTASGKYNLRLRAANSQIIAFTQQYATKSSATRAIGSCVRAIETYLDAQEATGAEQQSN